MCQRLDQRREQDQQPGANWQAQNQEPQSSNLQEATLHARKTVWLATVSGPDIIHVYGVLRYLPLVRFSLPMYVGNWQFLKGTNTPSRERLSVTVLLWPSGRSFGLVDRVTSTTVVAPPNAQRGAGIRVALRDFTDEDSPVVKTG
jgi:hypothetical protein